MVELKAADRRAIRSDSMERKSPAREVLGFLSRPYHFTRTSKIASDDRKKRNKVLPEIHVIVDNAWPSVMIASEVIHGAGMFKRSLWQKLARRVLWISVHAFRKKSNAVVHSQPSIAIAVVTSPFIASCG